MKKDFSTVKTQFDKTKSSMAELRANPSKRLKQDVKKGQKELIKLMRQLRKKYDVAKTETGFEGEFKEDGTFVKGKDYVDLYLEIGGKYFYDHLEYE